MVPNKNCLLVVETSKIITIFIRQKFQAMLYCGKIVDIIIFNGKKHVMIFYVYTHTHVGATYELYIGI